MRHTATATIVFFISLINNGQAQQYKSLSNKKLCASPEMAVVITGDIAPSSQNPVKDLTDFLRTKLIAYRVISNDCVPRRTADVGVEIVATDPTPAGFRGLALHLEVYTFDTTYSYAPTIWESTTALVNGNGLDNVFNQIKSSLGDQLDRLAADYVKANP